MKIAITKKTPIAMSPDEVAKCINNYTEHEAKLFQLEKDRNSPEITKYDIIHHNNYIFPAKYDHRPKHVMQYRSPIEVVDLNPPLVEASMVLAQYHCLLPHYKHCTPVRNVLDFLDPRYNVKEKDPSVVKIGYSPSNKTPTVGAKHNKGYHETVKILRKLKAHYGKRIEIDIITETPHWECLKRKSRCHLLIDECVTGSYHKCTLEAMALGAIPFNNMSDELFSVVKNVTGANDMPIARVGIPLLPKALSNYIENKNLREEKMSRCRPWMDKYWHPKKVIKDYLKVYGVE